jgi:hypothetical protein
MCAVYLYLCWIVELLHNMHSLIGCKYVGFSYCALFFMDIGFHGTVVFFSANVQMFKSYAH